VLGVSHSHLIGVGRSVVGSLESSTWFTLDKIHFVARETVEAPSLGEQCVETFVCFSEFQETKTL
jgi:hypothetical protein